MASFGALAFTPAAHLVPVRRNSTHFTQHLALIRHGKRQVLIPSDLRFALIALTPVAGCAWYIPVAKWRRRERPAPKSPLVDHTAGGGAG